MKGGKKKYHGCGENGWKISLLMNSAYYFLQRAFIINEKNAFRLVVINRDMVLLDRLFPSIRGAKIAFAKMFGDRTWKEEIKAQWTRFYEPEKGWQNNQEKVILTL